MISPGDLRIVKTRPLQIIEGNGKEKWPLEEARAGRSRTSASPHPLAARTPLEPAPFRIPGPTFEPATESNLNLWQTCSEQRLLHHKNVSPGCSFGAADSNQHDLHLDPVPLEPSPGPNHDLVRWLIRARERPRPGRVASNRRPMTPLMIPLMIMTQKASRRRLSPPGTLSPKTSKDEVSPGGWTTAYLPKKDRYPHSFSLKVQVFRSSRLPYGAKKNLNLQRRNQSPPSSQVLGDPQGNRGVGI